MYMNEELLMDENSFDRILDDYHEETADSLIKLYCRVAQAAGIKQTNWAWRGIADFSSNHDLVGVKTIRFQNGLDPRMVIDVSITGRTWLDLWIAADRALVASNEDREVAIEGFIHKSGDSVAVLKVGT